MKARRAVGCSTSAALVERFNRGWFSGSLTADPLRSAKNSHGLLVLLIVWRPVRAGPMAHREPTSGQKRTPTTKYRTNKVTCHASPSTGASPDLARVPTGSAPSYTRTPAAGERSGDRQAGHAPSALHLHERVSSPAGAIKALDSLEDSVLRGFQRGFADCRLIES